MIRVILCLSILSMVLLPRAIHAVDGVEAELAVYQTDVAHDSVDVLLFSDTVRFVKGIRANGFPVAFSVEIEFTEVDTVQAVFAAHVVTLGPPINNYSRQFRCMYGLPARLSGIAGKNGALYTLSVRPIRKVDIDTAGCGWVHYNKDDFRSDPSASIDIYYVPHTTGDFYWNGVKGLMEDRYRQFVELNKFTLPGKYLLYLAPCPIYSIIWDKRFGMMVDPTRMACYAIHGTSYNTVDPYLLMYASAARNYGYAPPLLLEGLAGYLTLAHYDMKDIVARKKQLPLATMLSTHRYLQADPYIADKTAASFVRYLLDQYKADRFLEAYRAADDLNVLQTLERVYGKSLSALEQEWLTYIDTVNVQGRVFGIHSDIAEAMFNYPLAIRYRTEQVKQLTLHSDSLIGIAELARVNYTAGRYYDAITWQATLARIDSANPLVWMALGSYQSMVGQYDSSLALLERARKLDTTGNPFIAFNLAMTHLHRGDTVPAVNLLREAIGGSKDGTGYVESRLALAPVLWKSKDTKDREEAERLCREAADVLNRIQTQAPAASVYLWGGIAAFGLGDTGDAQEQIASSIYLEPRPLYQAMGYLWLGKLADARGERDVAKENYRKVLELPSAAYHQDEARALLENRYVP